MRQSLGFSCEEICVSRMVCLCRFAWEAAHKPFIRRLGFFYWLKAIKISLQQGMLSLQFKSGRIETKHFVLLPVVNKGNKPVQKGK